MVSQASLANAIRVLAMDGVQAANSGHPGAPMGMAEIAVALWNRHLKHNPAAPKWADRDRFLMGKGHAAVGLFPILAEKGDIPVDVLNGYTRLGNPLGDHPDIRKVAGVDFSSGSIGHALSNGLGMALGGRMQGRDFTTFVMLGDGEMQEGQVWEAAIGAAHHKLNRLVAIVDRNGFQLDGAVDDVMGIEPLDEKWRAFGWEVHVVDGHNIAELTATLRRVKADQARTKPCCIIARTLKGKGVGYMETEPGWHLGYLDPSDAEAAKAEILSKVI